MRRQILRIALCLAVPLLPFVVAGPAIERTVGDWLARHDAPWAIACGVVAVLAADILLPVPSSFVSTFAGAQLGVVPAAGASWLGMTLGATIAFTVARLLGRAGAVRLASLDDVDRTARMTDRYGGWVIVVARGVPILAEASVLALGLSQLSWRRFLPALALSNLGIALVYSTFGHLARHENAAALALAMSIALPAAAALTVRAWLRRDVAAPPNLANSARGQ
ncbi:MAG: TVP38/TMEM64 family protein [Pirellulales bacterium]